MAISFGGLAPRHDVAYCMLIIGIGCLLHSLRVAETLFRCQYNGRHGE